MDERTLVRLYRLLRLTRAFDETLVRLYRQGKLVGGVYTSTGNEATAVGSAFLLRSEDVLFPLHRDVGAHLAKGQDLKTLFLNYLGREGSLTRGRDNTAHYHDRRLNIFGNVSHIGAMIPVAAGAALAARMRGEDRVAVTMVGDGGTSTGEFHEGLNFAAVSKLPLIVIIENNQFAYSTPTSKQFACAKLSDRAQGYGIEGSTIDGTDLLAVLDTMRGAITRARAGEGPTLIESVTMRMRGHSEADRADYVPSEILDSWKKKDPIARFESELLRRGLLTEERIHLVAQEIRTEIDAALAEAESHPLPEGSSALTGVYAEED